MGMDINATLMVGLSARELDITKAPLYDEYVKEHEIEHAMDASWWELSGDFYDEEERVSGLTYQEIHHENRDLDTLFIGFVIADSGSWSVEKLDPLDLSDKISIAEDRFKEMFGKSSEVLLLPRMW